MKKVLAIIILCVVCCAVFCACGGGKISNDYEKLIEEYFEQEVKGAAEYSYEIANESVIDSSYRDHYKLTKYIEKKLGYDEDEISDLHEYETEVYVNFERHTVCFMVGRADGVARIFDVDEGGLWGESRYEHKDYDPGVTGYLY